MFVPKYGEIFLGTSKKKEGIYVDIVDISEVGIGDLIRIPLEEGGYFFASTGQSMDSPVFKVMSKTDSGDDVELELQVMEVLAPYSLFYGEKSDHNKVLKALEVGPAVIRQVSVPWLIYTLSTDDVVERIAIDEISETGTIEVNSKKDRQNRCPNPVFGSIKLKEPIASAKFLLSHRPHNGVLELDEDAGTWIYLCTIGKDRNDHFEITIWDVETGAYAVQVVHIWGKCNAITRVTGVVDLAEGAIVSLSGIEAYHGALPVTGTITLSGDEIKVKIDPNSTVSLTGLENAGVLFVELTGLEGGYLPITGTVDLAADATVSISGLNTHDGAFFVELTGLEGGYLPITGTVGLDADATVSISGLNTHDGAFFVELTGLQEGYLPITGTVGLDADATVSISGLNTHDGAFFVELTGLEDGYLPITGTVNLAADATVSISGVDVHDGAFFVELTGLQEGYLPITGTVNLATDATITISGVNTHDGALIVELTGIKEPIDVTLKPIPLTAETVQLETLGGDTIFLPASNYRRQFTPLTTGHPISGLSSYTYLILINNLDQLSNVSFVVIEELEYTIGTNNYFAYTTNQSPEHLLPNVDPYAIRLSNSTPDPDAISSRVSILAQIEELTYRDNASYKQPALVTHDVELEVEISAEAYLILKREDIIDIGEG